MPQPKPSSLSMHLDPAGIALDGRKGLAKQLYLALRQRILATPDTHRIKLPTSRELALALRVSRNTVVRAYEQLYAEGYISSRVGDGTYADGLAAATAPGADQAATGATATQLSAMQRRLSGFGGRRRFDGPARAFRLGIPAYDLFPNEIWGRLQGNFWRRAPLAQMGYGEAAGNSRLRELIAVYLRQARGLICDPSQIMITAGAQHGIALCAQLLLDAGDRVAVENPCYPSAAAALTLAGAQLVGIPLDQDGMDTTQLAQHANCRMAYVTPSHQYPIGVTLSLQRRLELLAWAERHDAWIVEDDYDGEYRYDGTPLAPLAALDQSARVLYVGTFSKIAFPGLRLGYLVLPPKLVPGLSALRAMADRHPPAADQAVMAEFIAAGHFQRHIRRMRRASRARRDALMTGWTPLFGAQLPLPKVAAGLHLSLSLDSFSQEAELVAKALAAGVEINPVSRFCLPGQVVSPQHRAGLALGFAGVDEIAIQRALLALQQAWN
ncbi:bacterial regulatory s, gntR family protein [Collimonas arenae]|uniref:Bacterial regulatory s, gntR family protein n=1 Tax=Collimonas arenae TaxID=279058 RepID=A0A127QPH0_9BURK|nr:PLP-dependent aminotransferase family protein [Collimonas arenae]AMP11941.1 bacterial regulatory s, gntR family protein [Collimonas arenae]